MMVASSVPFAYTWKCRKHCPSGVLSLQANVDACQTYGLLFKEMLYSQRWVARTRTACWSVVSSIIRQMYQGFLLHTASDPNSQPSPQECFAVATLPDSQRMSLLSLHTLLLCIHLLTPVQMVHAQARSSSPHNAIYLSSIQKGGCYTLTVS